LGIFGIVFFLPSCLSGKQESAPISVNPWCFVLFLPGSQDSAGGGEIELAYHRIRPPAAELNWSQHVELLPVTTKTDKQRLEQRIVRDNLSSRQIRQEVRQVKKSK